MGYINHHVIVATTYTKRYAAQALAEAMRLGINPVVVHSPVNDYYTIFIAPDGSKEGWNASDTGDEGRHYFKEWLRAGMNLPPYAPDEVFCPYEWFEASYGWDDQTAVITEHGLARTDEEAP